MKIGDLVKKKNRRKDWLGIVLKKIKSTRPGLHCDPELRYEYMVRWFSAADNPYFLSENKENWWGGWSLDKVA